MKSWLPIMLTMLCIGTAVHAQDSHPGAPQLRVILEALKEGDAEALRSVLTEDFRSDLTDATIRSLERQLQKRLQGGYELHHMGTLIQDDFPVQFWKVSFAGYEEDALVRMVLFDGRVAGILITRPFV